MFKLNPGGIIFALIGMTISLVLLSNKYSGLGVMFLGAVPGGFIGNLLWSLLASRYSQLSCIGSVVDNIKTSTTNKLVRPVVYGLALIAIGVIFFLNM